MENCNKTMNLLKILFVLIALGGQFYDFMEHTYKFHFGYNPIIFSLTALIFLLFERHNQTVGYLISTFCIITAFRLSSLAQMHSAALPFLLAVSLVLLHFAIIAKENCESAVGMDAAGSSNPYNWHVTFIRLYFGLDLIPHFSEKLFAGFHYRHIDVEAFQHLGVSNALGMVFLAGCIEFFASIAFACGLFTRLVSVGLTIYLMIATEMGHHFTVGFIWASKGGGWEYPVLWAAIVLSFSLVKPTTFSLDHVITTNCPKMPKMLKAIMG